jgi:hypothetical protein
MSNRHNKGAVGVCLALIGHGAAGVALQVGGAESTMAACRLARVPVE